MSSPHTNSRIARFGAFELDLAAGELRKSGIKLRLQEQPFQVLAMLLERAGDVVTREELRQKLWPSDTFVDFDHSLNTAVNKVREALGDSASSPRYVETLARRGYRFLAPVQHEQASGFSKLDANPQAAVQDSAPETQLPRDSTLARVADQRPYIHPELHVPMPHRGLIRGLFALIQVMYLSFYLSALFRLHGVEAVAESFLPGWGANVLIAAALVTAASGIPLRCYLLSAIGFDYQRLGETIRRIFPLLLALDQLWAVAPFLLVPQIGVGGAFAASAALLYVPFAERTLVRLAYLAECDAGKGTTSVVPPIR